MQPATGGKETAAAVASNGRIGVNGRPGKARAKAKKTKRTLAKSRS